MNTWLSIALAAAGGLLLAWLLVIAALLTVRPRGSLLTEAVRLLPDLLRLIPRLARDPSLPRGVRVRLWLLLAYLAMPIDLVPDFIPVLGHARRRHRGRRRPARDRPPHRPTGPQPPLARHRRRPRRRAPPRRPARHDEPVKAVETTPTASTAAAAVSDTAALSAANSPRQGQRPAIDLKIPHSAGNDFRT